MRSDAARTVNAAAPSAGDGYAVARQYESALADHARGAMAPPQGGTSWGDVSRLWSLAARCAFPGGRQDAAPTEFIHSLARWLLANAPTLPLPTGGECAIDAGGAPIERLTEEAGRRSNSKEPLEDTALAVVLVQMALRRSFDQICLLLQRTSADSQVPRSAQDHKDLLKGIVGRLVEAPSPQQVGERPSLMGAWIRGNARLFSQLLGVGGASATPPRALAPLVDLMCGRGLGEAAAELCWQERVIARCYYGEPSKCSWEEICATIREEHSRGSDPWVGLVQQLVLSLLAPLQSAPEQPELAPIAAKEETLDDFAGRCKAVIAAEGSSPLCVHPLLLFCAHFFDLIWRHRLLISDKWREWAVATYAVDIFAVAAAARNSGPSNRAVAVAPAIWKVSIAYLMSCPVAGYSAIEFVLSKTAAAAMGDASGGPLFDEVVAFSEAASLTRISSALLERRAEALLAEACASGHPEAFLRAIEGAVRCGSRACVATAAMHLFARDKDHQDGGLYAFLGGAAFGCERTLPPAWAPFAPLRLLHALYAVEAAWNSRQHSACMAALEDLFAVAREGPLAIPSCLYGRLLSIAGKVCDAQTVESSPLVVTLTPCFSPHVRACLLTICDHARQLMMVVGKAGPCLEEDLPSYSLLERLCRTLAAIHMLPPLEHLEAA